MTYPSWEPRHRLTMIAPGKLDVFVLTLVNGKRAHIDAVCDYDVAVDRARAFHRDNPCQVKVLPLTGGELRNLLGTPVPNKPQPIDDATHQLIVSTITDVAANSSGTDARRDALALLREMGVLLS